jgi:hypothetical protein
MADQKISAATQVTTATAGTLFAASQSTTDYSVMDVWTIGGFASADRLWTLPGTAKVGEMCGIYIVDGDATYEVDIHTDNTADKIGNSTGFHSAGTEFTKLFIENECMVFMCVNATNPDWIVIYDGLRTSAWCSCASMPPTPTGL